MCDIEFVAFTDGESCTMMIFTNPGSILAGEYVVGGSEFFRFFHEFAFSHSLVDPEQPDSNRRKGAPRASQSAHRELAPTYPHQVYRLVCSHLRNLASAVDQYSSSSQPASLIFDPTSECNLNKFFSSFESASRICSRERTLR